MEQSAELLKSFAHCLAQAASKDGALNLMRMVRHSGFLAAEPHDTQRVSPDVADPPGSDRNVQRVGIWERKGTSGNFVRRLESAPEWYLWANQGRIGPKKANRRIVLIGESVARGYLYDPQFNPAKSLDSIFESHAGRGKFEVIDLARTSMKLSEMKALASSALFLEPDAVIIFAGNNWLGAGFQEARMMLLAAALRQSGVPGIKALMEEKHREAVIETIGEIGGMYGSRRIPLVWIIPEFNLGDWRDPISSAPYLANGGNREWIDRYRKAQEALQQGDFATATREAQRMLELDEGTTATPYYVLAECARRKGDSAALRACSESARDASLWSPYLKTPRPYSLTHRTMREELSKYGIKVVDLPKLFAEYMGEALPDRRLFVDYCHLSAEGIQIAMSAAAACILQTLEGSNVSWPSLSRGAVAPSKDIQGEAMFLAAVHSAHWFQPRELLEYFCRKAVEYSPAIAQVMAAYADVQTRCNPMLLCKEGEQIDVPEFPSIQRYLVHFNVHQLDKPLLDAILAALTAAGVNAGKRLDRLRIEERSVQKGPVDLLDRYYFASAPQEFGQQQPDVVFIADSCADYHKAYSPESKFLFFAEAGHAVSLRITCRLTEFMPAQSDVSIELNGECYGVANVSHVWQTWDVTFPEKAVKDGPNELAIRWGSYDVSGKAALEGAADTILSDVFPDMYPVFGEIHTLIASRAVESKNVGVYAEASELSLTTT